MSETFTGRCRHGALPNYCRFCDRERIVELEAIVKGLDADVKGLLKSLKEENDYALRNAPVGYNLTFADSSVGYMEACWRARHSEIKARVEELTAVLFELADIIQGHLDEGNKLDSFTLQLAEIALRNNPTGGGDWLLEAILLSRHEPMPPHLVGALRERLGEPTDIELEERRRLRNKPTEQSNNKS